MDWSPPSALRCRRPLTRRTPAFNSSLLFSPHGLKSAFNTSLPFSPHASNSNLQQFAAVLPSCAEVRLPTVRCCSPLTPRSHSYTCSLFFSPHPPNTTVIDSDLIRPSYREF